MVLSKIIQKKVVVFVAIMLVFAFPVLANASSIFTGGKSSSSLPTSPIQTVQGASFDVTTPSSYPSLPSGDVTSEWCAVQSYAYASIAQVGFASEPTASSVNPHYFYGDIPISGTYFEWDLASGPATSSTTNYKVQKENGYWAGYAGSTQVYSTNANVTPDSVAFDNETDSTAPYYYGTSTSKMTLANAMLWDGSASSSNTSYWVWSKPSLIQSGPGTGSSIDFSTWSSSSYWTSWNN